MTPFRTRIREIAEEALDDTYFGPVRGIEDAILQAITELLEREPSAEMMVKGSWDGDVPMGPLRKAWKAMTAQLLKEVKGE